MGCLYLVIEGFKLNASTGAVFIRTPSQCKKLNSAAKLVIFFLFTKIIAIFAPSSLRITLLGVRLGAFCERASTTLDDDKASELLVRALFDVFCDNDFDAFFMQKDRTSRSSLP